VADPGTHADSEGAYVRVVAFLVTMGGMLVFALMIGIISEYAPQGPAVD
jgi:ABC-type xylose transport system permease subunit